MIGLLVCWQADFHVKGLYLCYQVDYVMMAFQTVLFYFGDESKLFSHYCHCAPPIHLADYHQLSWELFGHHCVNHFLYHLRLRQPNNNSDKAHR